MKKLPWLQSYDLMLFIMKISVIQFVIAAVVSTVAFCGTTNGQGILDTEVTINIENIQLKNALSKLEKLAGTKFAYSPSIVRDLEKVTVTAHHEKLGDLLSNLLTPRGISYQVIADRISLYRTPTNDIAEASVNAERIPIMLIDVTGTVIDDTGSPLPGVNVLIKGTTRGTTTDSDGKFVINVDSENDVLVFSFIGYEMKEVVVGKQTDISVTLASDITSLEEIVVVGYGTQKKSDLTGAVGTVKTEEIQERQAPSVSQALAGRVSGVNVSVNSGRPGGQSSIRIRGFSSISTSNNPLYVIDGVIMPVGTQTDGNYNLNNAIDNINPSDIASVEILKDASSTAIYGARGANGVVIITTKRGSTGGGRITYNMQLSVPTLGPNPNRVKPLNAKEYLEIEQLGWDNMKIYDPLGWNEGGNPNQPDAGDSHDFSGARQDPQIVRPRFYQSVAGNWALFDDNGNPLYDTDWMKESTQSKLSQNHQLSLTGGNKENSYGVYLGYRDDNGLLLTSYLKRYSARFVMDSEIKPWLRIGGSISYNKQKENIVDTGTGGLNVPRMIVEALPILPVKYPNGIYSHNKNYTQNSAGLVGNTSIEGGQNPVDQLLKNTYLLNVQNLLSTVYANVKLTEGLEFRSIIGANVMTRLRQRYNGQPAVETANFVNPVNSRGTARLNEDQEVFWSFENYLTYTKRFNDIHSITAVVGQSAQETEIFSFNESARNFITDHFQYNNIGSAADFLVDSPPISSNAARFAFNSYFGRINYSLKDKYLLTISGRADGSSKFGSDNKYAFFPSGALAWRVSEEDFLKDNSVVSNLKLRTSYGVTGNSEIATYSALPALRTVTNVFNNGRAIGVANNRLGNPDLKWERTAQTDVGVEVGLFQNRISIEADVYYRKTTDMLLAAPLPVTSGYATITRNVGSMENKGLEIAVTSENLTAGELAWTTTFNISFNRNKVLKLANPAPIFGVGNPNFTNQTGVIMEGQPVGSFWGLNRLGTWSTAEAEEAAKYSYGTNRPLKPGDIKYLDVDGNYQINDNDRMIIGNGNPDFYGTLINNFRYKGFDLLIDIQFNYGNDVLNMTKHSGEDRTGLANSYRTVLNAWTETNQNTPIAAVRDSKAGYTSMVDTHWVEDGSFIRGRNIMLGYNFPGSVVERVGLSKARVYVSAQNFFLSTKYSGNDPEVNTYPNPFSQGQTFFDYPKPTLYMFGVSLGL
ncbi:SusC/RagA family TonB-linked outer membrane protein [Pseudochryseolinea flava]|uniref:SusC/RagA family TonB-linked outer membrane protein n=1 Tax=Pseudochryseolinea flava TaxID=2059302 RepID=A0A364Y146_9BACT|nr:TonB-dependent receptor [Pseudochryseolinea flava]RAW00543.1 SusC/RagA family TonB-linked outer membrane protein [Pseudochryseolinea flava]